MRKKYQELINSLTDKELHIHLYLTQIILLVISFVLGLWLFDDFSYLNNFHLYDLNILTIGFSAGMGVVMIDIILMQVLPSSYYDDGGLNIRIFKNRKIFQILFLAAFVSFSEELLFRGIIQTKVGLFLASLIFAIIHYRYLFNWFLFLNIVLLSFFIGAIFEWTDNLAVTIMMHFTIDFLLGLYIRYKHFSN
ncbi:CPBP family intramembrane glutamic endopeptidase [Neobacillus thermocopriae]|uniref:CPBP family intramembrane metalloprotease n=1 Tax=Neobacillus thermocopriae TaxID=1215031 RepID=A0A6B3TSD4_9BACI|nr:type II CAAX endopeptidase family protein [Neobacillus thermocopriae]MED3624884.1 type II CAAX endopeptidase family protein [Neobacillus thermocopriae]MED3713937.1 type II CAAX endopeptidase family protein [Neobacillus thermocopriae]NEX79935.1 CPBP family intramembrane metalloprotease [Neobacillus thermocopriae]